MDFIYTDTAKRHLRKIQHECQQLLKNGVFEDEICTHPISVPMFGQGETVSKDEIENLDQMYKYLSRKKITVRNLPLRPSGKDGTLDYEFESVLLASLPKLTLTSKLPYSSMYFHVWWKTLHHVDLEIKEGLPDYNFGNAPVVKTIFDGNGMCEFSQNS